ncbi:MAG: hypothetical protein LBK00_08515 [Treponema sp.]|jgi:hypothetical protein|nr:hypothetical protein [Treponema sp.]
MAALQRSPLISLPLFLVLFLSVPSLEAQNTALPRTFKGISLGMSRDTLKTALSENNLFRVKEAQDDLLTMSAISPSDENTLEVDGIPHGFIRRAFFELHNEQVFTMSFVMDTALVDHYSVFMSLVNKYGEPSFLDPKRTVWENNETWVAIERPLTVKYIDLGVFNALIADAHTQQSANAQQREDFLNEF